MVKKTQRRKHVPQRTCVGCRQTFPKRELLRLVLTADGQVVMDETGKRPGRGAYLCRRYECWAIALKKQRLNQALRANLDQTVYDQLNDLAQTLVDEKDCIIVSVDI